MSGAKTSTRLRIALLEDEPLRAAGFRVIFDKNGEADLFETSLDGLLAEPKSPIAIVGLHQGEASLPAVETIHASRPDIRLIVVGPPGDEELILRSIGAGAKAYLDEFASAEQVLQAVEVVSQGSIWAPRRILALFIDRMMLNLEHLAASGKTLLSPREQDVLRLLLAARSNREIAEELGMKERTVKGHVTKLMRKTGADSRLGLSVHALAHSMTRSRKKK